VQLVVVATTSATVRIRKPALPAASNFGQLHNIEKWWFKR
jgi:hypothetical protein